MTTPTTRPPRPGALLTIAAAIMLAVAGCTGGNTHGTPTPSPTSTVTVPDLAGQVYGDTRAGILQAGLAIHASYTFGADATKGHILTQDPPAGTLVAPDTTVTLTIDAGGHPSSPVNCDGITRLTATQLAAYQTKVVDGTTLTAGQWLPILPGAWQGDKPEYALSFQASDGTASINVIVTDVADPATARVYDHLAGDIFNLPLIEPAEIRWYESTLQPWLIFPSCPA